MVKSEFTLSDKDAENLILELRETNMLTDIDPVDMKPCPFCGHPVDMDDPDSVYPNGTGWYLVLDKHRAYHYYRDVPRDQWCYSVHCVTSSGGCGAEMSGDSKQEAIDKWNKRV